MTLRYDSIPLPNGIYASGSPIQTMPFTETKTVLTLGSTTPTSIPLQAATAMVQIIADMDCYIDIGPGLTALSSSPFLLTARTYATWTVPLGSSIAIGGVTTGGNVRFMEA